MQVGRDVDGQQVDDLPGEALARRQVHVGLDPHPADRDPLPAVDLDVDHEVFLAIPSGSASGHDTEVVASWPTLDVNGE